MPVFYELVYGQYFKFRVTNKFLEVVHECQYTGTVVIKPMRSRFLCMLVRRSNILCLLL